MISNLASRTALSFLSPWAPRLRQSGLRENFLLGTAFIFGFASSFFASLHLYFPAIAFIMMNRFLSTLATIVSESGHPKRIKYISDNAFFGLFVFFFMLGQNGTGIAAAFLLLSMFLSYICLEKAQNLTPIMESTEIILFMLLCCLFPQTYALFAIFVGLLFWVDAARGLIKPV